LIGNGGEALMVYRHLPVTFLLTFYQFCAHLYATCLIVFHANVLALSTSSVLTNEVTLFLGAVLRPKEQRKKAREPSSAQLFHSRQ
jgi:hypothetical protein